jgi:hypothetical protein
MTEANQGIDSSALSHAKPQDKAKDQLSGAFAELHVASVDPESIQTCIDNALVTMAELGKTRRTLTCLDQVSIQSILGRALASMEAMLEMLEAQRKTHKTVQIVRTRCGKLND